MAVRVKPRGAALPCSHFCSVRFEICNFNAASLCEKLLRSRNARSLRGNPPAANLAVMVEPCEPLRGCLGISRVFGLTSSLLVPILFDHNAPDAAQNRERRENETKCNRLA